MEKKDPCASDDGLWNQKVWDAICHIYWTPRFVGMSSIAKYPDGFRPSKSFLGKGYRLYRRERTVDELLDYLRGQEESLNFFLNIALAIAPDDILSRLLCKPLGIKDSGPFKSYGPREIEERYGFAKSENVTTPDGLFVSDNSLVAVELKLGAKSSHEQIAKYLSLMRWEQDTTGDRANLGLLFVLPENAIERHWSMLRLSALGDAIASTRKCPPDFLDKLDIHKPARICKLLKDEPEQIRIDSKNLRITAISWAGLRDEISRIEKELDCSIRGDQTLKRLLAGLHVQIEAHRLTGIGTA